MSTTTLDLQADASDRSISLTGVRRTIFKTRNAVFVLAVLAMNYTISRPSPVDILYILTFMITLVYIAVSAKREISKRAMILTLLLWLWISSFIVSSLPFTDDPKVVFEMTAMCFAISIGMIAAFVSMSWDHRYYERFMNVYIVSAVIASVLGTIGFVTQLDALVWDGRARGLFDDPNMYGSFLLPSTIACVYFLSRPNARKLLYVGALGVIMLGVMLSFSRIAQVATFVCLFGFVVFVGRRQPQRLILIIGSIVVAALVLGALASLISPEFTTKFLGRFTLAEPYDSAPEGRYARYVLVLPMILQNPLGIGALQLLKIFPEPIHDIWLSSFVNYGWLSGVTWIVLAVSSVVLSILNYRRTRDDIAIAMLVSLIGVVWCATLHEGEHWRHMWLYYGVVWGFCTANFKPGKSAAPPKSQQTAARVSPVRVVAPAVKAPALARVVMAEKPKPVRSKPTSAETASAIRQILESSAGSSLSSRKAAAE